MRTSRLLTVVVLTLVAGALRADEPPRENSSAAEETAAATSRGYEELHSPHEAVAIHVYVTPGGEQPLRNGTADYPVGTILLKEKLIGELERRTEMFTGMLKRQAGYNPDCGDWEFFTVDGRARRVTARGRIDSCMACHTEYQGNGFVARDYLFDGRSGRTAALFRSGEINTEAAERQWRDSDLVMTTRLRALRMVRVTDEPYSDLDSSVISQCATPDSIPRSYLYSGSQSHSGRIEPDSLRDRDYTHTGDDRTPFFGSFGEVPKFSNRFTDQEGIPRILLEP